MHNFEKESTQNSWQETKRIYIFSQKSTNYNIVNQYFLTKCGTILGIQTHNKMQILGIF